MIWWLGRQFRTPHTGFRKQRLTGTPQGAGEWRGNETGADLLFLTLALTCDPPPGGEDFTNQAPRLLEWLP